jgi:hypothetical protein
MYLISSLLAYLDPLQQFVASHLGHRVVSDYHARIGFLNRKKCSQIL